MGIRHLADEAERGLHVIPNSPDVGPAAAPSTTRLPPGARRHSARRRRHPARRPSGTASRAAPAWRPARSSSSTWTRSWASVATSCSRRAGSRRSSRPRSGPWSRPQNPWGQPRGAPPRLDEGPPVRGAGRRRRRARGTLGDLEVLYWVGCAAAFDERNRRVARAFATCLHAAGVRFAVLGQEEACTGDPARRMGNEYVFQMLADAEHRDPRSGTGRPGSSRPARTASTRSPTSTRSWAGRSRSSTTRRSSRGLLAEGRLATLRRARWRGGPAVTFHDACYLARYNGVIAAPREVLAAVPGLELRGDGAPAAGRAFCCGAGGGRMWMEETRGTRINAERAREALATGAEAVAVGCPFCMTMLGDGLAADAANAAGVTTLDLAEILAPVAVAGPAAGRTRPGAARPPVATRRPGARQGRLPRPGRATRRGSGASGRCFPQRTQRASLQRFSAAHEGRA